MADSICVNVRFTKEEHRRLKLRATLLGKSLSELMRVGLRKELRLREKEGKSRLLERLLNE